MIPSQLETINIHEIQNRYFNLVGGELDKPIRVNNDLICQDCLKTTHKQYNLIPDSKESIATCPNCHVCFDYQEWGPSSFAYSDTTEIRKTGNAYKRLGHFLDWLDKVQAKRKSEIPENVWQDLYNECEKLQLKRVTAEKVRSLLKRLKYTKFYDLHIAIARELNNIPAPTLTPDQIQILVSLFNIGIKLFDDCPFKIKQRRNFLSYPYFINQCCRMLGWDHLLKFFPLLQGEDNRLRHDRTMKWMCDHCPFQWSFHPTV